MYQYQLPVPWLNLGEWSHRRNLGGCLYGWVGGCLSWVNWMWRIDFICCENSWTMFVVYGWYCCGVLLKENVGEETLFDNNNWIGIISYLSGLHCRPHSPGIRRARPGGQSLQWTPVLLPEKQFAVFGPDPQVLFNHPGTVLRTPALGLLPHRLQWPRWV